MSSDALLKMLTSFYAGLLLLAMLGSIFASSAYLIFIYNPLESITAKVISFYPGSIAFELWKRPPYEVLVRIYIFNVTNPDEFLDGKEKLRFEEIGPYTYREELYNVNATFNDNGTLTFLPRRLLHFVPEDSVGDPKVDVMLSPNIPLLGISASLYHSSMFTNMLVSLASSQLNSQPFVNVTIHEYLYGYDDTLVTLANNIVPNWIDFPRFGILDRLMALDNGSDIVTINIDGSGTGVDEYGVDKWNGLAGLREYGYESGEEDEGEASPETSKCNIVKNAFMGTTFPSNLEKNTSFKLYRHAFCRPIPILYEGTRLSRDGFEGYSYRVASNFLATREENPDNDCFCVDNNCFESGLGDMSPCYYDIPIAMSQPHFYNADPALLEQVEGMSPDKDKHDLSMLVHPQMGVPLEAKLRIQINLKMPDTKYNSRTRPFNNLVLPLFWVDLAVDHVPQELKLYINLLYCVLPVVQQVLMYGLAVLGMALIVGSSLVTATQILNDRHQNRVGLKVNYSEIPVFPLKTKVVKPEAEILIDK